MSNTEIGSPRGAPEKIHFVESYEFAKPMIDLGQRVAVHEGQLRSVETVTSAIQSSLNAWSVTAIGVATLMIAVMAIFGAYQVSFNTRFDDRLDNVSAKADELMKAVGVLTLKVEALPAQISKEIRTAPRQRR
jgi:hypothetical protein